MPKHAIFLRAQQTSGSSLIGVVVFASSATLLLPTPFHVCCIHRLNPPMHCCRWWRCALMTCQADDLPLSGILGRLLYFVTRLQLVTTRRAELGRDTTVISSNSSPESGR